MLPCGLFARTDPPPMVKTVPGSAQVAVIASQYFITDMVKGSTPAHLRLILETVRPDILAVEAPANMADSWQYAPFDLRKVIKPWAKERNIPMMPVGHLDLQYDKQFDAMLKYFEEKKLLRQYQVIDDTLSFAGSAHKFTFKFINSDAYDAIWRNHNSQLGKLYQRNVPAEEINEKIVANILKLCKANPGKRIAVVINAPHSYYIKDKLRQSPQAVFLSIENSLNFPQAKLTEKTLPQDYLYALRMLTSDNFTRMQPAVFSHLETCLSRIKKYPEYKYDYHYFYGKMLLHSFDSRAAVSYFQFMTSLDPKIVLKFDNETSVRDSALVYIAIANLQMGQKENAVARLVGITKMPDVNDKTKEWANRILTNITLPGANIDFYR
jgi:hypothetical protein